MCAPITMTPWVGSAMPPKRVLILGESWYGPHAPLSAYLSGWCAGSVRDYLFSRIFNAASGFCTSKATMAQRTTFWSTVLFDNFVNFSVGPTRASRPGPAHFAAAAASFPSRLAALCPHAVWVLGMTQAAYSVPLLSGYHHVVSPHPCARGITRVRLTTDWRKL